MRTPKRTLDEIIQYLAFTMGAVDSLTQKRGVENKEALKDIAEGLKALEVAVDYLKLAHVSLEKEETEKRNAQTEE